MSRISPTVLALVATVLAASGCGGSTKALSRTELIAKADPICRRISTEVASLPTKSPQLYGNALQRVVADEQAAANEFDKLTPPASMATDWKQIISSDRTLAENTGRYDQYLVTHNYRAKRAVLEAANGARQTLISTAKRDGFVDCAQFA